MDTLFLFTKHLDDTGCLCLKIGPDGTLITSPAPHSFVEIKNLQKECNTVVIETSINASIIELELSWLPEKKARTAIPYALEDKLAQSLDELHFAFDKIRYQNNKYLITVISKQRICYIMQMLRQHNLDYTGITLDWFALEPLELCITEDIMLINTNDFQGALSSELSEIYLKNHTEHQPLLFADNQTSLHSSLPKNPESSYTWIAQRIQKIKLMNLCQGEMQHGNKIDLVKRGYQLVGAFFCLWLLSLPAVNLIHLFSLNKQMQKIDTEITLIYRQFFPESKQVISPKFRIMQLLKNNNTEQQAHFWSLLNQFARVMNSRFTLEQIRYQNKSLSVTITSPDFSSLEELENELKKQPVNVKQTQASTHDQHVVATLELT